jgi:hypothetical protein
MEIDIPIERDDRVQWRSSEERDEVPAYREQDEDYVDYLVNDICTSTYYVRLGLRLLRLLHISHYMKSRGRSLPNDQPNTPLALLRLSFIL